MSPLTRQIPHGRELKVTLIKGHFLRSVYSHLFRIIRLTYILQPVDAYPGVHIPK
jgi:hypothetical protein